MFINRSKIQNISAITTFIVGGYNGKARHTKNNKRIKGKIT